MAYTGVCMLANDKLGIFYQYVQDKLGRGVMTHELAYSEVWDAIKEASHDDFIELCESSDEPRVMALEEVIAAEGDDIYLEISTRTDEIPYITAATIDGVGIKGVTFYCSHFDFVAYNRRLYGWRCWTSRPTDEQRRAVKWDDA